MSTIPRSLNGFAPVKETSLFYPLSVHVPPGDNDQSLENAI